jgi:hypothetical protein
MKKMNDENDFTMKRMEKECLFPKKILVEKI